MIGKLRRKLILTTVLSLVLIFVKKRSLRVVFAAVLISLLSVVTEVLATMLTILLLGKYVDTALVVNEPRSMLMVQIIFWSIFALLCWVLVYIWRRSIRPQDEPYLRRFILVPLSQHFLVIFSAVLSLFRRAPLGSYLLLGAMALCCVLADFLLFRGLRNYTNQQLARQQAELLEEQLRQQLAYYNGVVAHIEDTARLRHELRNQLQTVYANVKQRCAEDVTELDAATLIRLSSGSTTDEPEDDEVADADDVTAPAVDAE